MTRPSVVHVWLRLTLAAFVLALYTALALGSGVARADEGPSASDGGSGTTGGTTSQQSGSGNSGTGATSGTTSDSAPPAGAGRPSSVTGGTARPGTETDAPAAVHPSQRDDPDRHVSGDTSTNTPKNTGTTGTAEPSGPTASGPQHTDTTGPPQGTPAGTGAPAPAPVTVDTTTPTTAEPTVPGDVPAGIEATPLPVDVPHNSKRTGQEAAAPSSAAAPFGPRPAVSVTPSLSSLGSTVGSEPATASVAVIAPSSPVPASQQAPGQPLVGLVSDVSTIVVSVVHTVAINVAQAFGPNTFLGVPYLLATTVANAAAAVGRTLIGAPLIDPPAGRFAVNYGLFDALALFTPTKPPPGANDPSITVTPQHPLPIILINGTFVTQRVSWTVAAPVLANAGYKVYTFNYGNTTSDPNFPIQAIADIRQSGQELSAEVDRVLAETGAPKVILIGESQGGGTLPSYYINNLGGAAKVSQLIGLSPSNHGTDYAGLLALGSLPIVGPLLGGIVDALVPALSQQALGSSFQQEVYGNGDTRPGVLYTTITSVYDEVVTPYTQQALNGPNVTNIILQDRFPGVVTGHINIVTSPQVLALVLDALASNPAANPLPIHTMVAAA